MRLLFEDIVAGARCLRANGLPDGHSESEPPESISNSEVKGLCADGSVGTPHARVGHRQALKKKTGPMWAGFFC